MRQAFFVLCSLSLILGLALPMAAPLVVEAGYPDSFSPQNYAAYMYTRDDYWATARAAADAEVRTVSTDLKAGVLHSSGSGYQITRGYMVFDTSYIPDNAVVTSAYLKVYVTSVLDTLSTKSKVYVLTSSMYPADPPVDSDFKLAHYNMPWVASSAFLDEIPQNAWAYLTFAEEGTYAINKTGKTRLCLVHGHDYANTPPGDSTHGILTFYSGAAAYPPTLHVEWVGPPALSAFDATDIGMLTAKVPYRIVDLSYSGNATTRGVVWDTSSKPAPVGEAPALSGYSHSITTSGSFGAGDYETSLTGLTSGATIYYRAVIQTQWGWAYSDERSFHTLGLPSITTSAATSVTNTTARLPGNVTSAGYPNPTVTVFWGDNDGEDTPASWDASSAPTSPAQPQGAGAFYLDLSSLEPGKTYYFAARAESAATSGGGGIWTATRSFSTSSALPAVVTANATHITDSSAIVRGNITSPGGDAQCTLYGFVWDTASHSNPGNTAASLSDYTWYRTGAPASPTGPTSDNISVDPKTTYYFRACASNSAGWTYGDELSFRSHGLADVGNPTVYSLGTTSVVLQFTLSDLWGGSVDSWRCEYATEAYWVEHSAYSHSTLGAGSILEGVPKFCTVSGLSPGERWHMRIAVATEYGTTYTDGISFASAPENPYGLVPGAPTYTKAPLSWSGPAYVEKWMLRYATGGFPSTPADGEEGYFDAGLSTTITGLVSGETYYFSLWSWVDDAYSMDSVGVVVSLPSPVPVNLQASPIDGKRVQLWWLVPDDLIGDNSTSAVIRASSAGYPTDPTAGVSVYDGPIGAGGTGEYVWTNATPGTPYWFSLWFATGSGYSEARHAMVTTPASYDQVQMPGDGSFNTPDDSLMRDMPGAGAVDSIADVWGLEHGMFWCILAIILCVIATMAVVVATRSGLVATGAGALVLVIANTQGICPVWVTMAFVFLGLVLSWVSHKQYG